MLAAALVVAAVSAAPAAADAPECVGQSQFVREDKPATLYATCFDIDGDALDVTISNGPRHGTATATDAFGEVQVHYDPDDGYRGPDGFDLKASDGTTESEVVGISLTVTRNHAPQCWTSTVHTGVGDATSINVSTCTDQDYQDPAPGLVIALDPAAPPTHGTLSRLDSSGLVTYTPHAGFTGADTFGVTVSDGDLTGHATQRVHVADGPLCSPAPEVRMRPGTSRDIPADCTQPPGAPDPLDVVVVDGPEQGLLTGTFTYTADAGASGPDPFTFKAVAGAQESPVATQAVVVDPDANESPACGDQLALVIYADHPAPVHPDCSDPDGDPLAYDAAGDPEHGTLTDEGGELHYAPDAGYTGQDAIAFTVSDGRATVGPESMPIEVREPEPPGCAPVDDLLLRAGQTRTVLLQCSNPQGDAQTYDVAREPEKGTLVEGSIPGGYRYTAGLGEAGEDSFELVAENAAGGSTPVLVTVSIDESANEAPVCVPGGFLPVTVLRNATTPLPVGARCSDADGDPLLFTVASGPQEGVVGPGPAAALDYAANDSYEGLDEFEFLATDSRGASSDPVIFEVEVVNDAPVCAAGTISVASGATVVLPDPPCTDANGDALTFALVTPPAHGDLAVNGAGQRTFTADAGYKGDDEFTYRASDGHLESEVTTVEVDVTGTIPTCAGAALSVAADATLDIALDCDDVDGDALTLEIVDGPAVATGSLGTIDQDAGMVRFTPAAGYRGPAQFRYGASDGTSDSAPATVDITVTGRLDNHAPDVEVASSAAQAFRQVEVTFTATAEDAEGDETIQSLAWDLDADGQFDDGMGTTAKRSFGALGTQTVKVRATDDDGAQTVASKSVEIVNRAPTADVSGTEPAAGPHRGLEFAFTATAGDLDGTIESLAWDLDADGAFDDGNGTTAKWSFTTLGPQTVRVQVTDDDGGQAIASESVDVLNRAPDAVVASSVAEAFRGVEVMFIATPEDPDGAGTITGLAWDLDADGDFDDGTGTTAKRSFTALGTNIVKVRVTDDGGAQAVASKSVQIVNRAPEARFSYAPAQPVADQTVTFTSGSTDPDSDPLDLRWDLDNDGQFDDATGASASRAFPEGKHPVWLRADDGKGATQSVSALVIVAAAPVVTPPGGGGQPSGGGTTGGGGGQPSGGGPVTGGAPAPDTKAPGLKVTPAKGQRLRTLLAGGMKLLVEVDEPGALKLQLLVDKATARKLGIDKRATKAVVIGTLSKAVVAGKTTLAVKLTAKARKALKRARSAKLQVAAAIADAAGNQAKGTQIVTLRN